MSNRLNSNIRVSQCVQGTVRFAFMVILALLIALTSQANGIKLASQSTLTNRTGAGGSFMAAISGDGKHIVFSSEANNLVTNDNAALYLDLFARDIESGNTTLLSVSLSEIGGGNGNSIAPSISSNGQWIAFESLASNLVANDTNGSSDIFLRDALSGTTTLISRDSSGSRAANGHSRAPHISANGRFVLFESRASNIVPNDLNGTNDVFVIDIQSGMTAMVSVNSAGNSANGPSSTAAMSSNGRIAVFASSATDIVLGATNGTGDIFVRDLQQSNTVWVSFNVRGLFLGARYRCFNPAISADGRVVAFKASRLDGSSQNVTVFRVDVQSLSTSLVEENSLERTFPQLNANGRFMAYESYNNLRVFEPPSTIWTISDPSGFASVRSPSISADGRWVAFVSDSTSLLTNSVNGLFQTYRMDLFEGTTRMISVNTNNAGSAMDTFSPFLSFDGSFVAFDSPDSQVVADDLNRASDVFIRYVDAERTELISARAPQSPVGTAPAMTFLTPNCLSSNGQFLTFATMDSNLDARDTNGFQDIFVRDLLLHTNFLVSVWPSVFTNANGSVSMNPPFRTNFLAYEAVISANGRHVAFTSERPSRSVVPSEVYLRDLANDSTMLVSSPISGPGGGDRASHPTISADGSLVAFQNGSSQFSGSANVFLRRGGSNYLVSINRDGNQAGAGASVIPLLTPDNGSILFYSSATDLTSDSMTAGPLRVFAHDLSSRRTRLLSVSASGLPLAETCTGTVVSANSQYVAFNTTSNSQSIYRFDLSSPAQTNLLVCTNCSNASISREGRFVAYQSRDTGSGIYQLFVKDLESNSVALASANGNGLPGNGHSRWPQISSDARYLVFTSEASDLVDNDSNRAPDIFVRDLVAGTTMLLSINAAGTSSGNKLSSRPVLAPDGRTVAFQSFASDLAAGDYNSTRDIFVVRLASPDSDNDGLDDDWELAFFNTLGRDGSGDFDNDGHTDAQEFRAGTDPTNIGSVLRVLTLTRANDGAVTVFWSAVPGKRYDVQYKDNVEDPSWAMLAMGIQAISSTASVVDDTINPPAQRFYRVLFREQSP